MEIITPHSEKITEALIHGLRHSVTILKAEGGYSHKDKEMLVCVINKHQLGVLKSIVKRVDPDAFFTIITVNGVYGKGTSFFSMKHIDS